MTGTCNELKAGIHKTHTGLQTASCISTLAGAFRGSTRAAPQLAMNVHAIGQRAQDGLCLSSMEKHGFKLRTPKLRLGSKLQGLQLAGLLDSHGRNILEVLGLQLTESRASEILLPLRFAHAQKATSPVALSSCFFWDPCPIISVGLDRPLPRR